MRVTRRFGSTVLAALIVAGGLGAAGIATAEERVVPADMTEVRLSFAPIVKKVAPAVVNVYARKVVRQQRRMTPFLDDPFFRHFFGDRENGQPRTRMQRSLGSGVVISDDGIILTNNHVIRGAEEVRVAFNDKRQFDCDVILDDDKTDLAVLKIRDPKGEKFPSVAIGDSDGLEVGDIVLAIGNPFGVGQTVTQGIVSALARTRVGVSDYQFFIQTDAAINPGNSGGALIDMRGNLVGINTAIYSRSGGSNGIGFAIPSNMARLVAESARQGGDSVKRPWLGASLQQVTSDIAESLGLDRPEGVLVVGVISGGPAEAAGLKVGDLIVTVDGAVVDSPNSFGYRFVTKGISGTAKLGIVRAGREMVAEVALAPAPETVPRDERAIEGYSPFAGITVANLSPAVAEELDLKGLTEGVVIVAVDRRSPAASVGLLPGDVIVDVNGDRIGTTRQLEGIAESDPRTWRIVISRNGQLIRMAFRG
ncbi:DegQ family serine endoprotease [Rhodobium orientis]|uniref:Serine protease n=1 Tax=Rhodobium orientis TaxID=34017 RepID=A0A327JF96_9HYPH|nr:serine protease [Rhodobium orientis]RAI24775.1 serine protease [Rhodobium orientis]